MSNQGPSNTTVPAPEDLPPPYSAVVGNPPYYGFVPPAAGAPTTEPGQYPHAKYYTPPGVYPHPPNNINTTQPQLGTQPPPPPGSISVPIGIVMTPALGNEPTTMTCFNCSKVITTRVTYTTAWHTHLVAGSICVITMVCSVCCLGLVPYCFDTFKDAEHYCPNCNTFIETIRYNGQQPPPYTPYVVDTENPSAERRVIHQTIIVQPPLRSGPVNYTCPACHTRIVTRVEYLNTRKTHMMAGFICGLTFWCMLCCFAAIPYITPICKQAVHYCPNCKTYLGSYSKM